MTPTTEKGVRRDKSGCFNLESMQTNLRKSVLAVGSNLRIKNV